MTLLSTFFFPVLSGPRKPILGFPRRVHGFYTNVGRKGRRAQKMDYVGSLLSLMPGLRGVSSILHHRSRKGNGIVLHDDEYALSLVGDSFFFDRTESIIVA
jgi:hypothetical protein